jgi:hypothetical protein
MYGYGDCAQNLQIFGRSQGETVWNYRCINNIVIILFMLHSITHGSFGRVMIMVAVGTFEWISFRIVQNA